MKYSVHTGRVAGIAYTAVIGFPVGQKRKKLWGIFEINTCYY